jgi:hypothetical protein
MTRDPRDTSAEEPDGGNLQVRFRRGPGSGNRPGLLNNTATEMAPLIGIAPACLALGVSRASFYRAQRGVPMLCPRRPRPRSPLALSEPEREAILELLHAPAYVDRSPRTVFAMLLDAGRYLASVSSFYRILREALEVRPRRNELTHPPYAKPELRRHRPTPAVVLGHHQAQGAGEVGALPPVCDPRCFQPLRGRLDARAARIGRTRP